MRSFLGAFVGVIIVNGLIIGLAAILVAVQVKDTPHVAKGSILVQDVDGPVPEYLPPSSPLDLGGLPLTQTSLLENLEKARHDRRIAGVVLRIGTPGMGWAKLNEVRERIRQLQTAGKPVFAYIQALGNRGLYLASACDSTFLLPGGYVSLHGFSSERTYLAGTLNKVGIRQNLHKIGAYKSAAEILQRTDMSEAARRNAEWILDSTYPNFVTTIEADRGLPSGSLETNVLSKGAITVHEALAARIVDRLADWGDLEASLLRVPSVRRDKAGKEGLASPPRPRTIDGEDYARIAREKAGVPVRETVAVVHAQGLIQGEKSGTSVPFGMTMGAATMEDALRKAAEDKGVKAILLRVDSGGGESSTSWRIMRAAARAAAVKPLVVSMSDVAASGAYMLSYQCRPLVADRLSVVGSIGSISGKFNLHGFYDLLGITKDYVVRGPMATIDSDYYDYTPEEWSAFSSRHNMDYQQWVEDIARHRNMSPSEVDSVGRGRVWTGEQALHRGLVDTLGTFDTAVAIAKRLAHIPERNEVEFVHYPRPEGLLESIREDGFSFLVRAALHATLHPLQRSGTWAVDWNDYR